MTTERMDWACENCGGTGEIRLPTDLLDSQALIVCTNCSTPSVYAWCERCGAGGEPIDANLAASSNSWTCRRCKTQYQFRPGFYREPIEFQPVEYTDFFERSRLKKDYGFVRAQWMRAGLQFLDKYGMWPMYVDLALFAVIAIAAVLGVEPTTPFFGWIAIVWLYLFYVSAVILVVSVIVSTAYSIYFDIKFRQTRGN